MLEEALFFVTGEGNYMLENKLNHEVHLNLVVLFYYHCCYQVLMVHMSKIKLPALEIKVLNPVGWGCLGFPMERTCRRPASSDLHSLSMTKEVLIPQLLLLMFG